MTMTIHHLGSSQSERIVWLFEELGLNYELIRYERDPLTRLAPPAYRALHPFGTAPVFDDGPLRLAESGAIIEYVLRVHGQGQFLVPPEHPDFTHFLYWWHFANASLMPAALTQAMVQRQGEHKDPIAIALGQRLQTAYDLIETHLGHYPYFGGTDFTAADMVMLFPLTTMRRYSLRSDPETPNLRAYVQRILARPAYQRAMARAEPHRSPTS